jgi:hypothetical protein
MWTRLKVFLVNGDDTTLFDYTEGCCAPKQWTANSTELAFIAQGRTSKEATASSEGYAPVFGGFVGVTVSFLKYSFAVSSERSNETVTAKEQRMKLRIGIC